MVLLNMNGTLRKRDLNGFKCVNIPTDQLARLKRPKKFVSAFEYRQMNTVSEYRRPKLSLTHRPKLPVFDQGSRIRELERDLTKSIASTEKAQLVAEICKCHQIVANHLKSIADIKTMDAKKEVAVLQHSNDLLLKKVDTLQSIITEETRGKTSKFNSLLDAVALELKK